ncbi:HET domain-containing protein [Verticillium alfalfae VaMs.102]|uniref:HET domain-containing protein n=1 Tax=Verticillium alfalfae (strain VaMs.102 / ATCC MYA-4576 / FGSC 10136) TaxID=526221 RepID=C9SEC0_VERA1|nr:HET domain-containing protein [Verticillium alfalfae VaMs.102]EEY16513.1 HET domain-containing protein [Verticillium alfalfae VaMs.102]
MRLLNVKTRKLEEFFDESIPDYAILSHTWGVEEVTLQDLENPDHVLKKGYTKIEGTCTLAAKENIEYIWIDTCCIDKTSSAELSEAINSMYRWYKSSQICYTYLSDVPTTEDPSESNSAFRRSRWFTRGWTLQELIAPRNLSFYDQEWKPIGTRLELAALVKDITAIPAHMLSADASRPWPNTAVRMSWAANRTTSRAEDIAYCLLGIFDIQMPLLYGEGNRAFRRLQLELLKQSEDESLLAWGLDSSVQLIIKPPDWRGLASVANSRQSRGLGVLAHHPGAFRSWQGLEASGEDTSKWPPRSKMQATNSGLEITVPLIKLRGRCYAVLNCCRSAHLADLLLVPLFLQAGSGKSKITYSRGQNIICASWAVLDQAEMQTIILSTVADVAPGSEHLHDEFLPLQTLQDDVLIVRLHDVAAEITMAVDHHIARDDRPPIIPFFVSTDHSLDKRKVQWINDHDHIVRLKATSTLLAS